MSNKYFIYKLQRKIEDKCCNVHNGKQFKQPCYMKVRDPGGDWVSVDHDQILGKSVMFHRGYGMEHLVISPVVKATLNENTGTVICSKGPNSFEIDTKPGDVFIETENSYYFAELEVII